ncbi:MAG: metal-dependent hydrolase [Paraclostridium sp.]|uniref:metal-dependent hydrolase n=1 Tax=Paraclostridium sp. TaxID=2023273 RepID=UPI003F3DC03E
MLGPTHRFGGIAFGALTPIIAENLFSISIHNPLLFAAVTMAGGAIGSLIPDIDSPSSTIGQKVKPISRFIAENFGHRGGTHSFIALAVFAVFTTFLGEKLNDILRTNLGSRNHLIFSIIVGLIITSSILFVIKSIPTGKKKYKKPSAVVVLIIFIIAMFIAYLDSYALLPYIRVYLLGVLVGYASHILLDMFTRAGVPFFIPFFKFRISFTRFKTGSIIESITKVMCIFIIVISVISLGNFKF